MRTPVPPKVSGLQRLKAMQVLPERISQSDLGRCFQDVLGSHPQLPSALEFRSPGQRGPGRSYILVGERARSPDERCKPQVLPNRGSLMRYTQANAPWMSTERNLQLPTRLLRPTMLALPRLLYCRGVSSM